MNRNQYSPADFSLSEGGPLYKALLKVNLHNSPGKLAIVVLAVTWLPLGIINAFAGTLYSGAGVTFLKDVAIQARLLVALPILIIIRLIIDDKVIVVLKYLSDDLMDAEERELMMTKAFRRAKILTYSSWTELILLFLVISITTSFVKTGLYSELEVGTRSWMAENKAGYQTLSLAGDWTVFISLPIFQFLFFRWLWRYFVWVILLFRLSRARLNLQLLIRTALED